MTRRELLQDRYEDARFALLMDELGAAEGEQAEGENERLNADGAAAVPEDLDRRCRQTIRRARTRRRLRSVGRFTGKALKRVALAAGVAAILFTTAFATSETVRVYVLNLAIEVFETNTEFRFSSLPEQSSPQLYVGWFPAGYTLAKTKTDDFHTMHEYRNHENMFIRISCREANGMTISIDTENAVVTNIEIKDSRAMLIQKESGLQLAWVSKDNTRFITITGSDISREDILHIADELSY